VAQAAHYPLKSSATNPRILVDHDNVPFLVAGDSPHALFSNLSSRDAAAYLADRPARGINCMWVNLLCIRPAEGRADASLLYGTKPFTQTLPSSKFYFDDGGWLADGYCFADFVRSMRRLLLQVFQHLQHSPNIGRVIAQDKLPA